jgi:N-acetylmuramoyl-L-alanine amidase
VPQAYNTTPGTQAKGGGDTRWAADLNKSEAPAVVFCVQLAASPRPTDVQSGKWQSSGYLIQVVQEEDLYKYQVRNFKQLEAAMEARIQLQNNGFPDAFIVAYHQGKRISMADAKKLIGAD